MQHWIYVNSQHSKALPGGSKKEDHSSLQANQIQKRPRTGLKEYTLGLKPFRWGIDLAT